MIHYGVDEDIEYGKNAEILIEGTYGYLVPLKNANIKLNINEKESAIKTDNYGFYVCNYTSYKIGKNTVTISYPGNANFKAATATETFNVIVTKPIQTYITMNNIKSTTLGNYATISGHYYYSNNIPLTQTTMRLNINGQTYTTKTDNNGYFTYNYKTNKAGTNKVIISYPGNTNFKSTTATKTFVVSNNL
jgi:phosphatidate phosphatase APP1